MAERLAYKGITKKRIRVAVQRLVLILPVEDGDKDSCGGQAVSAGQRHGHQEVGVPGHGIQGAEEDQGDGEQGIGVPGHGGQGDEGVHVAATVGQEVIMET